MSDTRTTVQTRTTVGTKVGLAFVAGAAIAAAVAISNTSNVSKPVTNSSAAVAMPNLTFAGANAAAEGGAITSDGFFFAIQNKGTKEAAWPAGAKLYRIDWVDESSSAIGTPYTGTAAQAKTLAPNATESFKLSDAPQAARTWYAAKPAGAKFVRMTIDPDNTNRESSENDNMRNLMLPLPNISLKDAKYDAAAGLSFSWLSNGSMGTGLTFKSGQYIYGLNWLRSDESEFGATLGYYGKAAKDYTLAFNGTGSFATATDVAAARAWIAKRPDGAAKLKVTLDPIKVMGEADENDNSAILPIPLSDIKVMSASAVGTKFSFTYSNIGSATANWKKGQAVYILYWLGDGENHFLGSSYGSKAAADKALVSNIPQTVDMSTAEAEAKAWFAAKPVGAKKIRILFSPGGTYAEANQADNTMDVVIR